LRPTVPVAKIAALVFVALVLVAVVVTVVLQARHSRPWPLKRHLGHWRTWDDDEWDDKA
jgi:membrane-associated PAP2 superfamily phosphatase